MRKLFVVIGVVCSIWLSGTISAQAQQPLPSVVAATSNTTSLMSQKDAELLALQKQNDLIRQYHSSLLDTVYWALGLVGVVAALIVGASGLINFKVYEADKERLREQFTSKVNELTAQAESKISEARAAIQAEVQSLLHSHTDRISGEILAIRAEIVTYQGEVQGQLRSQAERLSGELLAMRAEIGTYQNEVQGRLRSQAERLSEELLAIRAEIGNHQSDMQAQFRAQVDAVRTDIAGIRTELTEAAKSQKQDINKLDGSFEKYSTRVEELNKRVNSVETLARYAEEMTWRIQGIPMNTLRAQYQGLNAAIDSDSQWQVDMLLKRILSTLEVLQKKGEKQDAWTLDQARFAVERAPADSTDLVQKVLRALDEVPRTEA